MGPLQLTSEKHVVMSGSSFGTQVGEGLAWDTHIQEWIAFVPEEADPDLLPERKPFRVIEPSPLLPRYIAAAVTQAEEDLEDGDTRPSDLARTTCEQHFGEVASLWRGAAALPMPFCGTAGDGEVFCEWRAAARRVFVTVYPNGYMRLFWVQLRGQQVAKGRTVPMPTPAETVTALEWVGLAPSEGADV